MQLIVLGMHRSGTSVLARMLNLMGAFFGSEGTSTGANKENPKGFWERRDVRMLNDDVLFSIGCDWNRISALDLSRISPAMQRDFEARAFRIVLDLDAHRPWLLKEPRLCLLLPLWKPILELPVCIHIVRDPVEVAASLHTRNDIPLPAGLALWEQYNRLALRAADGLPLITVQHRHLMMSPDIAAEELFGALRAAGVAGLRKPTPQELAAFVRQDLYREREADLPDIGASQRRLFEQIVTGECTRTILEERISTKQAKVLQEYESSLPPFSRRPSAEEQRETTRRIETEAMEQLKAQLEARNLENAKLKGEFGLLKEWAAAADAARADALDRLAREKDENAVLAEQFAAAQQMLSSVEQLLERTRTDAAAESRRLEAVAAQSKAELESLVEVSNAQELSLRSELNRVIAAAEEQRATALSEQAERHSLSLDAARREREALQGRLDMGSREIAMLTRRLLQAEETVSRMQRTQEELKRKIGRQGEEHAAAISRKSIEADELLERIDQAQKQIGSLQARVKHTEAAHRRALVQLAASTVSSEKLAIQCVEARQALEALQSSHSWRWSAPLRIVSRLLHGRGARHSLPVDAEAPRLLRASSLFDAEWYLRQYPDVAASKVDPVVHYLGHGASEGRDPGPGFSTRLYLARNPDVSTAGINPLLHYLRYGGAEGRSGGLPEKRDA